jgi:GNAT superfamily N-acetyltransferase
MKLELTLLRASPEHAGTLTNIAIASKRHWDYPERWIQIWTPQLTISPDYTLANETWLATINEQTVAFYSLKKEGDSWWLDHLWVLPSSMGQGLGALLFRHALARCRRQGVQVLNIESDPNAVGFYEKMGARKVDEHHTEVDGQPRQLPVMEMRL